MVAEAAAGPSQEEEARQASVQELQSLRDSLSQAEARTKELEGQLENLNKVILLHCIKYSWNRQDLDTVLSFVPFHHLSLFAFLTYIHLSVSCPDLPQVVTERETEMRNVQEQSTRLQTELTRLRQELQDKASQEDTLRQQMADKEEKTRKAIVYAKQKISQLMGEI